MIKDILSKTSDNKGKRLLLCLIIALPIWAFFTFVDFTPDVVTEATVIEDRVETNETGEIVSEEITK